MNPTDKEQYKKQPACYQIEWVDAIYIGHTQNAHKRFHDHLACWKKGYKSTRRNGKGQTRLYSRDWSKARLSIEYFSDKIDAWRREHELYKFWYPTGKLLNQELPIRQGVLAINLVTGSHSVYSSTRVAAKELGLHYPNIMAVCSGRRLSAGLYTFQYL
jgi:predicted GIY-YIG superfamily endonuclease